MSIQAVAWVLQHETTTKLRDRLVLLALANHASSDDWECWPSITTLARETNLAKPDTVRASLKALEAAGLITRQKQAAPDGRIRPDRKPNLYRILRPEALSDGPPSEGSGSGTAPPPKEERPPITGVNGPPSQGSLIISDPSPETSVTPAAEAAGEEAVPLSVTAQRLAAAHWDTLTPKPMVPFLAVRARVTEALQAGWTEDQVAAALTEAHSYTRGALDFILRKQAKQRPKHRAPALNEGRDLATGEVKL